MSPLYKTHTSLPYPRVALILSLLYIQADTFHSSDIFNIQGFDEKNTRKKPTRKTETKVGE
jgi:hypothetical protein